MNRIIGVIVAALGLIVAVQSIAGLLPGLTGTGVTFILLGGLIIGLSFIDKPDPEGTERMSTAGTLANIFVAPSEVFQNLRRHPRWLVAMILMAIMSTVYTNLFINRLTAERVVNYTIDKTLELPMMNDDARRQVESGRAKAIADAKDPVLRTAQAGSTFTWSVIGHAFLALLFFLFALAMGGKLNFWQAFSVAVYASFPIAVIRFVLNSVLLYVKDPAEIHPILGGQTLIQDNLNFLVLPSEHPVIYTVLGSLSLLSLYWVWLNSTGLKNGGERVSGSTAWTTSISIFLLLLLLGVSMVFLFPSFLT